MLKSIRFAGADFSSFPNLRQVVFTTVQSPHGVKAERLKVWVTKAALTDMITGQLCFTHWQTR
jgi:hypothetical protein